MLSFAGRGFKSPRVEVQVMADGIHVRGDDESDSEKWVELFLDWEEVRRWEARRKVLEVVRAAIQPELRFLAVGTVQNDDLGALPLLPMPEGAPPPDTAELPKLPDAPDQGGK